VPIWLSQRHQPPVGATERPTTTRAEAVDQKKFLTLAETALVTGVAKRSLQRLIADGQFPVVRFGRCVRIPVAALEAMAEAAIESVVGADSDISATGRRDGSHPSHGLARVSGRSCITEARRAHEMGDRAFRAT
jgi:excisionase family DNA binding protein